MKRISFLIVCFVSFLYTLTAQNLPFVLNCNEPPIPTEACQTLNASGGLTGREVFCEGEQIIFNNLTPQAADTSIICWGDGIIDILRGNSNGQHVYDFSRDTCLKLNNGLIRRTITLIVCSRIECE